MPKYRMALRHVALSWHDRKMDQACRLRGYWRTSYYAYGLKIRPLIRSDYLDSKGRYI